MRINTNLSALNAYRNLNITDSRLSKSLERLSSGLRINRAADDAAGLAISEKMRGQIRGLNQATRNAMDGISLMQTAEGALNETHAILQRMRELSVQASSDTLTSSDRIEIQREIEQLVGEMDRIASSTEFNTKKLLDGSSAALTSTSDLNTKIFMRGGLRTVDQFGQKAVGGGNYKLDISAMPGQGEVQKTDIMKVKHGVMNESVDEHLGHATFVGSVAAGATTGTVTLNFDVDGNPYVVSQAITTGDNTATAADIASTINSYAGLNDSISASSTSGELIIRRYDSPGESFRLGWSIDTDSSINGIGSRSLNTVSPADENIQGMSYNANDMLVGDYEITTVAGSANQTNADATSYVYTQNSGAATIAASTSAGQTYNMSVRLELTSISTASGSHVGTFSYSYEQLSVSGVATQGAGNIDLSLTGANTVTFGNISYATFELTGGSDGWSTGDKIVANTAAYRTAGDHDVVTINDPSSANITFNFLADAINNSTTAFSFYQLDLDTTSSNFGQFRDASIDLTFGALSNSSGAAAGFEIKGGALGQVASLNSAIYDIDRFWDANGNFLVQDPKTINMVQGDGKKTQFTIFGSDTIADIEEKMNNAIHEGLGQKTFNSVSDSYVSFITGANVAQTGFFTVEGTFVIQSAITGKDGEIRFSGDEGVISALSLTTLQKSVENEFNVTVTNAHDPDDVIAENNRIVGNLLVGVVHENVDVKFDPMAGVVVDAAGGDFEWNSSGIDSIFIHLSDNTMVFHIGANPLQDVAAAIGDMSSEALGVDNILVTNRESANRALSQVDYAIGRVSTERAKLGAVQNRLEHTINNLGVAAENLSAAESRIRDLDFALEMVEFTRNQIMMQAGTSMLAQANMKPQSVLMLLQ